MTNIFRVLLDRNKQGLLSHITPCTEPSVCDVNPFGNISRPLLTRLTYLVFIILGILNHEGKKLLIGNTDMVVAYVVSMDKILYLVECQL